MQDIRITFSIGGKIVAVLSRYFTSVTISIYDVVSGVYMHDLDLQAYMDPQPVPYGIWAHGQSFRFVTPGRLGVTIWEIGSAPGATPTEVQSLPTVSVFLPTKPDLIPRKPNDFGWAEFHPALCQPTFIPIGLTGLLLVWDARASKFSLHDTGVKCLASMSFSPDGRFFACTTTTPAVYLWKESPTGYTLSKRFEPGVEAFRILLSPNGESLITFHRSTIELWDIKGFSSSSSSVLTPPPDVSPFLLEFHPDKPLVALARSKDKTVMVLDLKSGAPELTIDTSIEAYGLRPIGNTIVVAGDKKVVTWDLPGGDPLHAVRMNVDDSIRTINFHGPSTRTVIAASISPDFQYIALACYEGGRGFLEVYCASTGWNHCSSRVGASALRWALGGHDIWCASQDEAEVFTVTQDAISPTRSVTDIEDGPFGSPWGSSPGYEVTRNRLILGMGGKRLLMMPPLWGSPSKMHRVWNGKFLALLHGELPEPVILELEP